MGRPQGRSANEALQRLPPDEKPNLPRLALVEAVRALLALAAGDRDTAKQHVDVGLAWAAGKPPPALLLASARVRALAGDTTGAGKDLDSALQAAPEFAPVVADWAAQRLDSGDAVAARRATHAFLAKNKSAARVHLVAADAERALGERGWTKHIEAACHSEGRVSRAVRAACSLAAALDARLDGERSAATAKARAAGQASEDPRVLADSALVLASLGEIDAADEVLARARKLADATAVPLAWADLAVRLGRGQADGTAPPAEQPALPERYLVALRACISEGRGCGPGRGQSRACLRSWARLILTCARIWSWAARAACPEAIGPPWNDGPNVAVRSRLLSSGSWQRARTTTNRRPSGWKRLWRATATRAVRRFSTCLRCRPRTSLASPTALPYVPCTPATRSARFRKSGIDRARRPS